MRTSGCTSTARTAACWPSRPSIAHILDGVEEADSLVVNPHKWLFTPFDCSALFIKRPDVLKRAFSLVPEYLVTREQDEVVNYMDYGVQLGRRFRALKLWMVIRAFGVDGLAERLREHCALARTFADWVESSDDWKLDRARSVLARLLPLCAERE